MRRKNFKNIRTGYGRYLKKLKSIPSGSGRDAVPVPKDFAGLDWLQQYISHRPTVSNISLNPVEVDSDEDDNEQGDTNNLMESKILYERVKCPKLRPVFKNLPYPKSMFPNYLLSFSPVLYCHEDKHNA